MPLMRCATKRIHFYASLCVALAGLLAVSAPVMAQEMTDDMVGQNEAAWMQWSKAMTALASEKVDEAEPLLTAVLDMNLSDLRLALMAERSGSLRLEQAVAANKLGATGETLWTKITNGRRQKMLAEDGWHFAQIGRFAIADANFKALIDSAPDAVALLELARYNNTRHTTLIKLMSNTEVGDSAKGFLQLLAEGEDQLRKDPVEINANIARLAGTPRMAFNAAAALRASGEYAVPHLVRNLIDPAKADLKAPIIKLLPELGRESVNPMVIGLSLKDQVVKQVLIEALGKLGYRQAVPYLAVIAQNQDSSASAEVVAAARDAMRMIESTATGTVAALFHDLAEQYHAEIDSLRPDERVANANVWYIQNDTLVYIPVPREIFVDIMAMRCCESALTHDNSMIDSAALWLASNFRREAKLGMNVESEAADVAAARDNTKQNGYPRSIYFARAAGPLHNHLVLKRAVLDRDPSEALGAIAALSVTAGAGNMVGPENDKQALVESLSFPHRLVRVKAALAIARTLPRSGFNGAQLVPPVLNEALTLSSGKTAMVIDGDDQARNKLQAVLRTMGVEVVGATDLNGAMEGARAAEMSNFDMIVIASDTATPDVETAVRTLRNDFVTAATPIVIVMKAGDTSGAMRASNSISGTMVLPTEAIDGGTPEQAAEAVLSRYRRAASTLGVVEITDDIALGLSLEAADVLRSLALSGANIIEVERCESGLQRAFADKVEELQIRAGSGLALIRTATAQESIAAAAMKDSNTATLRLASFALLAESARRNGNMLSEESIDTLATLAMDGSDLVMRTAASQALGALDLPSNRVTTIILTQTKN